MNDSLSWCTKTPSSVFEFDDYTWFEGFVFHTFDDNFVSDFHNVSLFGWVMNIVYHTFRAVALLLFASSSVYSSM